MFHTKNNWIDLGVNNEKVVPLKNLDKVHQLSNFYRISNLNVFVKRNYFKFYDFKIGIFGDNFKSSIAKTKLKLEVIIISNNCKLKLNQLIKMFDCNQFIIDSSCSKYITDKYIKDAKSLNVMCWSVSNQGAFLQTL